jgi:hypothetical protein
MKVDEVFLITYFPKVTVKCDLINCKFIDPGLTSNESFYNVGFKLFFKCFSGKIFYFNLIEMSANKLNDISELFLKIYQICLDNKYALLYKNDNCEGICKMSQFKLDDFPDNQIKMYDIGDHNNWYYCTEHDTNGNMRTNIYTKYKPIEINLNGIDIAVK